VLVGIDGMPRVVDFGVAKANTRLLESNEGQLKGKLAYMSPELFAGAEPDGRGARRRRPGASPAPCWAPLRGRGRVSS
jgi:serine/threonine protein kinase